MTHMDCELNDFETVNSTQNEISSKSILANESIMQLKGNSNL